MKRALLYIATFTSLASASSCGKTTQKVQTAKTVTKGDDALKPVDPNCVGPQKCPVPTFSVLDETNAILPIGVEPPAPTKTGAVGVALTQPWTFRIDPPTAAGRIQLAVEQSPQWAAVGKSEGVKTFAGTPNAAAAVGAIVVIARDMDLCKVTESDAKVCFDETRKFPNYDKRVTVKYTITGNGQVNPQVGPPGTNCYTVVIPPTGKGTGGVAQQQVVCN